MNNIVTILSKRQNQEVKFQEWKEKLLTDELYDSESLQELIENKEPWSQYPLLFCVKMLLEKELTQAMEVEKQQEDIQILSYPILSIFLSYL